MEITTYTGPPTWETVSHYAHIKAPDDQASHAASAHFAGYPDAQFAHVTNPETELSYWYERDSEGRTHLVMPHRIPELETLTAR